MLQVVSYLIDPIITPVRSPISMDFHQTNLYHAVVCCDKYLCRDVYHWLHNPASNVFQQRLEFRVLPD